MLDPENVTDFIYQELSKVQCICDNYDDSKNINILNLHCSNEVIAKNALNNFIVMMRGLILQHNPSYIEIEGPLLVNQKCFLNRKPHVHYEWNVITN